MKSHDLIVYYLMLLIKVKHAENKVSSVYNNTINNNFINIFDKLNRKVPEKNYVEDINLRFPKLVTKYGYPVEEHEVKTSDGYLLTMFRIPKKGPAVLLVIGPLLSPEDFVTIGSQAGLAYQLADAGYDVWLGNCRGNKYSLRHVILSIDSATYWDFTFDEMGRYDAPALIDYVLNVTNTKYLKLLGYSLSTNIILVLCSEKPEYNNKISVIIFLSPTIFMGHVKSPFFKILAGQFTPNVYKLTKLFGVHSLLGGRVIVPVIKLLKNIFCVTPKTAYDYCHNIMFFVFGPNHDQINTTSLPVIYGHFPTSTSMKSLQHVIQLIRSGTFRQYDSGVALNVIKYGLLDPPEYFVKKVTTKIAIVWAENDWASVEEDIQILVGKLPNIVDIYKVPNKGFSHTDFLFARDVKTLVYDKVIEMLKLY